MATANAAVWERVHTINEYYDGPVFGVADVEGQPHVYDREWDDAAMQYGARVRLSPVEPDLLALVLEDWRLFLQWDDARRRSALGEHSQTPYRVLPQDIARHEALMTTIGDRLESKRGGQLIRNGVFRFHHGAWQVSWAAP